MSDFFGIDNPDGPRRTLERVATRFNVAFMFAASLLGGLLFMIGLFGLLPEKDKAARGLDAVPVTVLLCWLGAIDFALFFPFASALYFARYFMRRLRELEQQTQVLVDRIEELSDGSG